jgi:hypothetical protein
MVLSRVVASLLSSCVLISSLSSSSALLRGMQPSGSKQQVMQPCPVGAPCPAPRLCPDVDAGKTGGPGGCPIWIDSVQFGAGRIGMSYLPGRVGPGDRGLQWNRSMTADIAAIKRWGASDIISLPEEFEFAKYGVAGQPGEPSLKMAIVGADIAWHHW